MQTSSYQIPPKLSFLDLLGAAISMVGFAAPIFGALYLGLPKSIAGTQRPILSIIVALVLSGILVTWLLYKQFAGGVTIVAATPSVANPQASNANSPLPPMHWASRITLAYAFGSLTLGIVEHITGPKSGLIGWLFTIAEFAIGAALSDPLLRYVFIPTERLLRGNFEKCPTEGSAREILDWEIKRETRHARFPLGDRLTWYALIIAPFAFATIAISIVTWTHGILASVAAHPDAFPSYRGVGVGLRLLGIFPTGLAIFWKEPLTEFLDGVIRKIERPETITSGSRPSNAQATAVAKFVRKSLLASILAIGVALMLMPPYALV